GYVIDVAESGYEAIAKVKNQGYGVVLLNIDHIDRDGLTLFHSLIHFVPGLPIVILASHPSQEEKIAFLKGGAFDFLSKPFTIYELKATLRRALMVKFLGELAHKWPPSLVASEDRFRAIVEAAEDAIILSDKKGNILSWNSAAQKMFGYAQEEIVGKPLTLLMPSRYREAHQQGIERAQLTGELRVVGRTVEFHGLNNNGEEFPIELSLSRSEFTGEIFYCGIIRDIRERKRTEETIREGERRFRAIYDQAPTGIAIIDSLSGQFKNINKRYCEIVGYSQDEMLARTFQDITYPDDLQADLDNMKQLLDGTIHSFHMEKRYLRKDGEIIWVNLTCVPLWFEKTDPRLHIAIVEDITERIRTQEALREQEERLKLTIDHINDAVVYGDLTGKVIWANQQWGNFLGRPLDQIVGQSFMKFLTPKAAALAKSRLSLVRQGEEVPPLVEFEIARENDFSRWVEANVKSVIRDDTVIGRLLVVRDITERKQAELDLEERNRMLALDAEVAGVLNQNRKLRRILQDCTEALVSHLGAAFARIWILKAEEQVLVLQASAGMYTHLDGAHSRIPVGQFKIGQIAEGKCPIITNTVIGDPRVPEQEWAKREGLIAFAGYPLIRNDEVLGVMALFARQPLTEFTLNGLGMVADRITSAIGAQIAAEGHAKVVQLTEQILASIEEGIYGLDLEGRTTFVNPAAAKMIGWKPVELIGKPLHDILHHTKPDGSPYPREECPIYAAFVDGEVHQIRNEVFWHKDGTSFPVEYTSTPIWDDEQLTGAVVKFKHADYPLQA
ncbi:MAG: PAS domain S-box protein, partial [Nitrospirales bacterium]|nr:PAS domain S-box protein [Nitrospirales bacterium]